MKRISAFTLALVLGIAGTPIIALASVGSGDSTTKPLITAQADSTSMDASSSAATTDGEIKKIDKDAGKITIKHAELKNLEMPAMTMVFQVKDKSMLDQVKAGDKVSFVAEKIDGKFTVTQLETRK